MVKVKSIYFHILGSIIFLCLPILLSPDLFEKTDLIRIRPFRRDFLSYFMLLGYFYLNYLYLIPKLFFARRYVLFFFSALLCYMLIGYLPSALIPGWGPRPHGFSSPHPHARGHIFMPVIWHYFFQFLLVLVFSIMIKIYLRWKDTEVEKTQTALAYLKAQINPHFFFNTLNTIYSLAIQKSEKTAEAVAKLSGLMRYVIRESGETFVPLDNELQYISDYVELQKMRFDDTVKINYEVKGDSIGKTIAPLILIPFIENAFKHGVNPEEEGEIKILIEITTFGLNLRVTNIMVNNTIEDKTQIGLQNTINRLALLYPGRHELKIQDQDDLYSVTLNIFLQ